MEKSFGEIFDSHRGNQADKWMSYLSVYEKELSNKKREEISLLEIGVNAGGSLEVWAEYFPNANVIVGIDINRQCERIDFSFENIKLVIGDASTGLAYEAVTAVASQFDVVIDDGSHNSRDIVLNLLNFLPAMKWGGKYIIEDLCCSYWVDFGGGLRYEKSALGFLKKIIDVINCEHWRDNTELSDLFGVLKLSEYHIKRLDVLRRIHSVTFYNSMCVLTLTDEFSTPSIGRRITRGTTVAAGYVALDGQEIGTFWGGRSASGFGSTLRRILPEFLRVPFRNLKNLFKKR